MIKISTSHPKGGVHLLWDCSTIGRMLDAEGPTAKERLATPSGDGDVLVAGCCRGEWV